MPIFAKINASMALHDKIIDLPSDAARWAFLRAILAAKHRDSPEFSKAALQEALGTYSRHIPTLVRARLIDQQGSKYVIHDFDEHQGPLDSTAAKRMRAYRQRQRIERESESSPQDSNGVDNVTVTRNVTPSRNAATVTGQSRVEQSREVREDEGSSTAREDILDLDRLAKTFGLKDRDDLRLPVALVLQDRYRWKTISGEQWDVIESMVDNEYPLDHRAGFRWAASFLQTLPFVNDPLEAMLNEVEGRKAGRAERTQQDDRSRADSVARQVEADDAAIEAAKSNGVTDEQAEAHRSALADFASGLGSPRAAKPRGSTEGRQPT